MEGLFYCFESAAGYPVFQLLRFYPESEYVIATSIHGERIDDVSKVLKRFAMDGHKIVGDPALIYCGAFSDSGDRLQFKIENELADPSDTWSEYDLLTFKGTVVSENELQLEVSSKQKKWVRERTYLRVAGNELSGI
jgi:hypothetical protein